MYETLFLVPHTTVFFLKRFNTLDVTDMEEILLDSLDQNYSEGLSNPEFLEFLRQCLRLSLLLGVRTGKIDK